MGKKRNNQRRLKQLLNKETEILFMCASPLQLKKSLYEVYAFYLQNIDVTIINPDFNSIAMDFYFLHHFLEKAAELEKNMSEP
jgi:hypothetical protein